MREHALAWRPHSREPPELISQGIDRGRWQACANGVQSRLPILNRLGFLLTRECMSPPSQNPIQPIEWLCGLVTIPQPPLDSSKTAEPIESLIWMIPNGPVLGSMTLEPCEAAHAIIEHFHETARSPLLGEPHKPARIRTASEELAEVLRHELGPAIQVVCSPTPEFDVLLEGMGEFMRQQQHQTPSYLSADITPEVMAGFFRAAAALYRATPWTILPADISILVDVISLSLQGAALIVMGHGNQEFGFLLFASPRDFDGFLLAAKTARPDVRPPMPLFALDYNRGADILIELRKEATVHGWQVADANAYPALTVLDAQFVGRATSLLQLHQAEAIALALAEFAQSRRAAKSVNEPAPASDTRTVQTHAGDVQVKLTLQNEPPRSTAGATSTGKPAGLRAAPKKKRRKY